MSKKDEKPATKTASDVSPTRTKATWKPGVTDDSIPFFRCATCGSVVQGIDGPNGPTFSGLVRRPDVKLPYATNSFAPSCCGAPMEPLTGPTAQTSAAFELRYDIVGGFDENALRVYWTSNEGAAPRWIALPAAIAFYLIIANNQKIREDYAWNKDRQRIEDEETARQLEALRIRMEALKSGAIVDDEDLQKEGK